MCVTNIAKRRNMALANLSSTLVASSPSVVSQRLIGNFLPVMNTSGPKPVMVGTSSTGIPVDLTSSSLPTTAFPSYNNFVDAIPNSDQQSISTTATPPEKKRRPKRRRKPQKPGKTAKQNDRHFVIHNYHDHAKDPDENDEEIEDPNSVRRRGGVATSFPTKLHSILDQVEADGLGHIISWQPHGRCFVIHKPKEFVDHVMPYYFRQSKLTSFQRQLNLYGFARLTRGKDAGGYYHELFLRGKLFLARKMQRTKIKGTKFKAASSPDQEPDFYTMSPLGPTTVHPVSDDSSADGSDTRGHYDSMPYPSLNIVPTEQPMNTSSSFQVFPARVPRDHVMPSLDPTPLQNYSANLGDVLSTLHQNNNNSNATRWNSFNSMAMAMNQMNSNTAADDILDAAVDELFHDNPAISEQNDWEDMDFGMDDQTNDLQLGYLLEGIVNQ